jgi:hypothetical protein
MKHMLGPLSEPQKGVVPKLICSGNLAGFHDLRKDRGPSYRENAVQIVLVVHQRMLQEGVRVESGNIVGVLRSLEHRVIHDQATRGQYASYFARYQLDGTGERVEWGEWSDSLTVLIR